jgi:hypothetical protein
MTADLRISYGDLDTTKARLDGLVSEFENIQASQDAYDGAMGSSDVAGAMNNFAGNWTIHREKLLSKMQKLDTMVEAALIHFPETDRKLASEAPR